MRKLICKDIKGVYLKEFGYQPLIISDPNAQPAGENFVHAQLLAHAHNENITPFGMGERLSHVGAPSTNRGHLNA